MTMINRRLALAGGVALIAVPALAQQDAFTVGSAATEKEPRLPPAQAKALEEWSYTLAVQAATWGSPAVTMYALRSHDAVGPDPKAPPNDLWRMENTSYQSSLRQTHEGGIPESAEF